jgi:hypothetical protein
MGENVHIVPYAQAIRGALSRLACSTAFGTSPKLMAFLRFAVESVLAGDAHLLKAYTIGIGALGRRTDFDPATDAIVRVEAGRLRDALARYYDGEGATDPVIIDMPRGSYVPNFAWRNTDRPSTELPSGHQSLVLRAECQRLRLLLEETARAKAVVQRRTEDLRAAINASRSILAEARATLAAAQLPTSATPLAPRPRIAKQELEVPSDPAPRRGPSGGRPQADRADRPLPMRCLAGPTI